MQPQSAHCHLHASHHVPEEPGKTNQTRHHYRNAPLSGVPGAPLSDRRASNGPGEPLLAPRRGAGGFAGLITSAPRGAFAGRTTSDSKSFHLSLLMHAFIHPGQYSNTPHACPHSNWAFPPLSAAKMRFETCGGLHIYAGLASWAHPCNPRNRQDASLIRPTESLVADPLPLDRFSGIAGIHFSHGRSVHIFCAKANINVLVRNPCSHSLRILQSQLGNPTANILHLNPPSATIPLGLYCLQRRAECFSQLIPLSGVAGRWRVRDQRQCNFAGNETRGGEHAASCSLEL